MRTTRSSKIPTLLLAGALMSSGTAHAVKPEWAGGKHENRGKNYEQHERARQEHSGRFFDDRARGIVIEYYGAQIRAGQCPPGLAKKRNGCLPPGQAKKWARGYPLPADVRYYELPDELVVHLPPPPPQHRYVRVAGDILLIAIGTSIVVDAIEDIVR